jgi:hypothetical protein
MAFKCKMPELSLWILGLLLLAGNAAWAAATPTATRTPENIYRYRQPRDSKSVALHVGATVKLLRNVRSSRTGELAEVVRIDKDWNLVELRLADGSIVQVDDIMIRRMVEVQP